MPYFNDNHIPIAATPVTNAMVESWEKLKSTKKPEELERSEWKDLKVLL